MLFVGDLSRMEAEVESEVQFGILESVLGQLTQHLWRGLVQEDPYWALLANGQSWNLFPMPCVVMGGLPRLAHFQPNSLTSAK